MIWIAYNARSAIYDRRSIHENEYFQFMPTAIHGDNYYSTNIKLPQDFLIYFAQKGKKQINNVQIVIFL